MLEVNASDQFCYYLTLDSPNTEYELGMKSAIASRNDSYIFTLFMMTYQAMDNDDYRRGKINES